MVEIFDFDSNFFLIRICSNFFEFYKNGGILELKTWSFNLRKNYNFGTLIFQRTKALQSTTGFFNTPCTVGCT